MCPNCRHSVDRKDKFFVVVCLNPNPLGFFINSKNWKKSGVLIAAEKYTFLKRNSYIACNMAFSFEIKKDVDIHNANTYKGRLCPEDEEKVMKKVRQCRYLEIKHRKHILEYNERRR